MVVFKHIPVKSETKNKVDQCREIIKDKYPNLDSLRVPYDSVVTHLCDFFMENIK